MKNSDDFDHLQDVVLQTRSMNFKVFTGLEEHLYASLVVGAVGGTIYAANLHPKLCVEIYEKTVKGEHSEALCLQGELNQFLRALGRVTSGRSLVKTVFNLLGLCGDTVCAPIPGCSERERAHIRRVLEEYKIVG